MKNDLLLLLFEKLIFKIEIFVMDWMTFNYSLESRKSKYFKNIFITFNVKKSN